jgi:hypothetical protein
MEEVMRKVPVGKQPARVIYRMSVKLAADAPSGVLKHDLVLKTNDKTNDVMILSVDGNIQEELRAVPNQLNFGAIKLGETKLLKIQVQGNKPFRITDIRYEGKEFTADIPPQPAMTHTLTLRCQPMSLGALKRTLTIVTDLNGGANVSVSVQATGQ